MSEHKRKARKRWFKAKDYGWGWFPISWEGWAVTVLYALLFTVSLLIFFGWVGAATESQLETRDVIFGVLELLLVLGILSYSLYRICTKWGEPPAWRWGRK